MTPSAVLSLKVTSGDVSSLLVSPPTSRHAYSRVTSPPPNSPVKGTTGYVTHHFVARALPSLRT